MEHDDSKLDIQIDAGATTGYAAIQNSIPIVRGLTIHNRSDEPLEHVELRIHCEPAFANPQRFAFDVLQPGESRHIAPIDLKPNHTYLINLDETEKAAITVRASSGSHPLATDNRVIEVLAYDQWAGTRLLPELLAAFCMPNSLAVDRILGKASKLLTKSGCHTLNGYQSKNRENVWKQVSAIYSALLAEQLQYAEPPASFGSDGQKIRNPERILDGRVATCLDLAMFFAACFEQAGLRPVVLFKERHAWIGVWLIDTNFPSAIVDDVQAVRKRVKSGEFIVLETTGIATGGQPSLRWACSTADAYLDEEETFQYAVDIHRARELQIRPLPSRSTAQPNAAEASEETPPDIEEMPALPPLDPELIPVTEIDTPDTPDGRLTKWKRKLLDLTLRNRLLNFKQTHSNVKLICPDPHEFEDLLSDGKEFRIKVAPQIMEGKDPRSGEVYSERTGRKAIADFALDALHKRELVVDLPEDKLDGRLTEIFRAAQTGNEEGGANTLFLVFGFLQWREDKTAESSHLAPILLIPVTLTRQSVRSGFKLKRHDDDAIVNPTLIQKLQKDFQLTLPPFDVLPTDEKGLDVAKIFQTFRLKVAEMEGWEVKEDLHLGIFSFTKYLMWKDLQDRQQQLQENAVVAHLINNPNSPFANDDLGLEPRTLDTRYKPQDLFTPMLSDSSQLRAICVAGEGGNLVLEGPPGTGKSQTITNLICHLLTTGKTVLFVSEKMAALEVVQRRLESIGLGPFCLELHSSKANKAEILAQLGTALQSGGTRTVKEWELEADRLAGLRGELNAVVEALHRAHHNDLTIYEAMGTSIKWSQKWQPAHMDWGNADQHDRRQLDEIRALARQMAALAGQLSEISGHPLRDIEKTSWTPSWQQDLLDASTRLAAITQKTHNLLSPVLQLLGLNKDGASWREMVLIDQLADVLLRIESTPSGVAKSATDEVARHHLKILREHGIKREEAWSGLHTRFKESLSRLKADDIEAQWLSATTTWWPKSWLGKRSMLKRLGLHTHSGAAVEAGEVAGLINGLRKLNEEDGIMASMEAESAQLLQDEYKAHDTDWKLVARHEQWARDYSDILARLSGGDLEALAKLKAKLLPYLIDNRSLILSNGMVGIGLVQYRDVWRSLADQVQRVTQLAGRSESLVHDHQARGALQRLLAILQAWGTAQGQLQSWCLWRDIRAKALAAGMGGVVRSVEMGEAPLVDMADYFEFSYQSWWLNKALDREPALCAFASVDHDRKIDEFRKSDARFQKLIQQYAVAVLSKQVPAASGLEPGADTEMGKLRRELRKQRRHLPIRQLVQNLPTLLPRLKPCLLMSPISIAQYLEAGHAQFDVVVFDEASQIPVWDAVGAIARGKQLVCVGDPKQLPPTNFFHKVDDSDEAVLDDEIQDMESILDECLSIGLPKLSLDWHYRSRHESLITFSNATYYENRLITFPSPVTEDRAVRLEMINGVYDRGGSRTNRAEAEAIVGAIERHYLDHKMRQQSIGVVTFNQAQQALIENLMDARRRASHKLDQAITQSSVEPLFVKNLENVQGDERDVILFSITYGPDATGKVALNFGPLNQDGGHRRLNVAVSRARHQVVIYSTLRPEHIDLSRVRAAGVRDLKNYLDFAMRGPQALVEESIPTGLDPDSPFEVEVISALRDKGWNVHPQVGVSGYRIDIGIVDPHAPGRYLLGVECDGKTYHSAATARDRDRLRQQVLEELGWNIHRIWSTDWWRNKQLLLQKLLDRLEALLKVEREAEEPPVDAADEDRVTIEEDVPEETETRTVYAKGVSPVTKPVVPKLIEPDPLPVYRPVPAAGGQPQDFYEMSSSSRLRTQLVDVINHEGPIQGAVLFRRVARAWGLMRTGSRIEERLRGLLGTSVKRTREGEIVFYWPLDVDTGTWEGFRVADDNKESKRGIDEIALEELANLAIFLLKEHGSSSTIELARSICRLQGIDRTSEDAEARIIEACKKGHGMTRLLIGEDGWVSIDK